MTADIVVLRHALHGMPLDGYREALASRLPDADIRFVRTPQERDDALETAAHVTGVTFTADLLDAAPNLRWFQCAYAGTGHLPMDAFDANDVAVTNAAGVHGINIAEHVVGEILLFTREFRRAFRQQERHEWNHYRARELAGSTVTVVGLGAIGETVATRLEGFDVDTIGVRYTPEKGGPTDEVIGYDADAFHDALSRTDYLVLACPLTDETEGLIGRSEIATLPPEAVLINVARGPVVDTDALVWALRTSALRGAALDVTDPEPLPSDHPLWSLSNCFITPHNAGHTPRYYERLADIVAENFTHIRDTGTYTGLKNQVR